MSTKQINLLPPSRRQQLRNETVLVSLQNFFRTLNGGLLMLSIAAVLAAVLLTAALPVVDHGGSDALEATLEDYQQLRNVIIGENILYARVANTASSRLVWTDFLRELLPTLPSGVRITYLSGHSTLDETGERTAAEVSLRGQAATRTTLVFWQNRLAELSFISDVVSPTSNLLDRVDLDYALTLVLADDDE